MAEGSAEFIRVASAMQDVLGVGKGASAAMQDVLGVGKGASAFSGGGGYSLQVKKGSGSVGRFTCACVKYSNIAKK